jgi:hypothetical protein
MQFRKGETPQALEKRENNTGLSMCQELNKTLPPHISTGSGGQARGNTPEACNGYGDLRYVRTNSN